MAIEVINCSCSRESSDYQVWKHVQLIADVALILVDDLGDTGDLTMLDYRAGAGKLAISSDCYRGMYRSGWTEANWRSKAAG